ncbi:unnamed protein product [Cyberlindnera jadinii]|uniref:Uncharacterized protein n=1 Tax=Cyberlindnera jadinii (strain ATCC 18201 / CBS 1600 / BCRC 20928 / JCM 3617 / NBRC 0987 / NRRL Y-1542) TaxID=983966 RepID=A0A0H5C058_CYBJN|nr:hypothetical protein CYBJADRAFT_165762 [Cyberlindnera jadinii NRRL Y-1542]ODV76484.1 hypothetical protein CYBJADRAFT_165762 [Cyberlindnera jadinii NRRL Y-1542]CEP21113.1 unnamed protein product [Cyberlindnera jadinii]
MTGSISTVLVNIALVLMFVIELQSMLRLHRHANLDSKTLHFIYQAFFIVVVLYSFASIDLYHFKLVEAPQEMLPNVISSACLLLVSVAFIIGAYTAEPLDSYTDLEEQLLLSSQYYHSTNGDMVRQQGPRVSLVSSEDVRMKSPTSTAFTTTTLDLNHDHIHTKDAMSPMVRGLEQDFSLSTPSIRTPQGVDNTSQTHPKTSPILATLLSAHTAMASHVHTGEAWQWQDHETMPYWMTSLPIILSVMFLTSQLLYGFAMLKTSVFTKYRDIIIPSVVNLIVGTGYLLATLLGIPIGEDSLINFTHMATLNYVVYTSMCVLSIGVLTLHFYARFNNKSPVGIHHVQVYHSIGTP